MQMQNQHTFQRRALACAALVFAVALCLYIRTAAPTVTLVDSGELIVAARSLGVAHPPGFPFYLMLAHLASLVPLGTVALRVNLASALFGAGAAGTITLVVAELLAIRLRLVAGQRTRKKAVRKTKSDSRTASGRVLHDESIAISRRVLASAATAGLVLAFSRTLWFYATITEVYTLNTLLLVLILFLMVRWRQHVLERQSTGKSPDPADDSSLYVAATIFGLGLGVHHVTIALILPALAIYVYRSAGIGFFRSKRLFYAALVSIAALVAVYSYLPLAATHQPILNWGNPRSLSAIWAHVTGRQYQQFLTFSPSIMSAQFSQFARFIGREFGVRWLPITLGLALAGLIVAFQRDRVTFWFLLLIVLADLLYTLNYDIAEDKDAYYLPVFVALTIAAGIGLHWLLETLSAAKSIGPAAILPMVAAAGLLIPPAIALVGNWPFNNRSGYYIAQDYVENIEKGMEPNGLLLTLDWQVASPMLYMREIEGRRRDIKVIDVQLLRRPWYFDYLRQAYPDLFQRCREPIERFLPELKNWEANPEAYARNPVLTERIVSAFHQLFKSLIVQELTVGPVYVTYDVLFATEGRDKELTEWINTTFQEVPRGLVFELMTDFNFQDSDEVPLQLRGLSDGTVRFEPDDVVKLKLLPAYETMLLDRGRYLAHFGRHERAIGAFEQALALAPHFELARQGLEESRKKIEEVSKPPRP